MAVGFYDGGNDGDNGGNDPLIRVLDMDDLVTRVPPELIEPSQPTDEPEETTADPTPNPGESPGERWSERGTYKSPIHHTKLAIYYGIIVIGRH